MKNIIIIFITLFALLSCKKEKIVYSLSGQFLPCTSNNNTINYELIQNKPNWRGGTEFNILASF